MTSIEKIARVLRTDQDVIRELARRAELLTGKKNVIDAIVEENNALIQSRLQLRGFEQELRAEEIYEALVEKIKEDDIQLYKALGKPSFLIQEDVDRILGTIKELVPPPIGFFLKKDKAADILRRQPPKKIIAYLGYQNVDELLEREEVEEVMSAIRLFGDAEWLNAVFAKEYLAFTPDDFERREIVMRSLDQKWVGLAQQFLVKKYQNISHLKELGFIFAVPTAMGIVGETTRMFSLALHYLYEVEFYSDVFERFAQDPGTFAKNCVSALRVDVIEKRLPESDALQWLVLPSYLAKHDENDWRLFEPHVSPEALHWRKGEAALMNVNRVLKDVSADFSFWLNLDWVGDFFKTQTGVEILVSFNLVDMSMSLIKERELEKYLYHHQESLWNKIFIEYFGYDALEKVSREYIAQGWFAS